MATKPVALITGASGEVGTLLVPALKQSGYDVVVVDLLELPRPLRAGTLEAREWAMGIRGRIPSVITDLGSTATLAGIHHGITNKIAPPPKSTGNACAELDLELPFKLDKALDREAVRMSGLDCVARSRSARSSRRRAVRPRRGRNSVSNPAQ